MTCLHMVVDLESHIKKSIDAVMASLLDITKSIKAWTMNINGARAAVPVSALSTHYPKNEVIRVLEKAANDDSFIAQLTFEGSKALKGYRLTAEEKAALLSGDISWIEAHNGKLTDRLSTRLWSRLQQEIW